jgi:phytoene/squalene synthetase
MSNGREDLDYCEQAIKNGSLSFHAASRLLPNAVRNSCLALYAFCRLADDEVDLKEDKSASVYDLVERLDQVYSAVQETFQWIVPLQEWLKKPRCLVRCLKRS